MGIGVGIYLPEETRTHSHHAGEKCFVKTGREEDSRSLLWKLMTWTWWGREGNSRRDGVREGHRWGGRRRSRNGKARYYSGYRGGEGLDDGWEKT